MSATMTVKPAFRDSRCTPTPRFRCAVTGSASRRAGFNPVRRTGIRRKNVAHRKIEVVCGERFGILTTLFEGSPNRRRSGGLRRTAVCLCDCGRRTTVFIANLRNGHTLSCGCLKAQGTTATHGMSKTRLYTKWSGMISRCEDSKGASYRHYGGRGITVCQEWRKSFVAFRDWALANGYREGLTIERKDVNGNYEPGNCTWIPRAQQAHNKQSSQRLTYDGRTLTLAQWTRDPVCSVSVAAIQYRLRVGKTPEIAVTAPVRSRARA